MYAPTAERSIAIIDAFIGDNYYLSNFYETPVCFDGITYQNNEAAFQAQKTQDVGKRTQFAYLKPQDAKHAGRKLHLREDWETVKYDLMYQICKAKFLQHPDLAQKLLDTGNEELIEGNDWGDRIWGAVDGNGQNHLGKILMRIRKELSEPKE